MTENGTAVAVRTEGQVPTLPAVNDPDLGFIRTLDERWRLAKALASSGMIPQRNPEGALAVMLKAHELGIPAMQGFATIHFFSGKLTLSADLMVALAIQRCGVTMQVVEMTPERCELRFTRKGWEPVPSEYTMEDAKRAGLTGKDNWKGHPKAMLAARAKAQGVRLIAPDAFAGTYATEEFDHDGRGSEQPEALSSVDDLNAQIRAQTGEPDEDEPIDVDWGAVEEEVEEKVAERSLSDLAEEATVSAADVS